MTQHPQDVVKLILDDHRRMEELLRRMRSVAEDRAGALRLFAALLIAHGEAEEDEVYPALRTYRRIDDAEVEHGVQEHSEGNRALLALLEVEEVGSGDWDEKLERLVAAVTHHTDEEERTLLNGARENVPASRRAELGAAFRHARTEHLKADCGRVENVRKVVQNS
ncbi:hemerythrin domain-containing protein [Streptomyces sp. NBC_00237]|uniref:hemerythrin domain-containing protein n=1 Tax=Streptomyces sp. NBC_00237 TaxID=2975687 RepID=UPI00225866E2|nr:hemerythrin domain-containing protein [Streptomyces sp. NBC_00237]MCX5205341.1 hemerythrin domain-containing protein [Streptomyces sp. NBC_00237]